jgi:hypothetical protein
MKFRRVKDTDEPQPFFDDIDDHLNILSQSFRVPSEDIADGTKTKD